MSGDGSKKIFVSTFRIQIKPPPPRASSAPGNGPGTIDTGASDRCTDAGKDNKREKE